MSKPVLFIPALKATAALFCLLAVVACASKPDEHLMVPRGTPESFGYSDWRVDEIRYVVSYSGPEVVTTNTRDALVEEAEKRARETALGLAMWRAADLALADGFPEFTLAKVSADVKKAIVGHDYRQNGNPVYDDVQGEALGYQTAIYFRPEVTISVELHKDRPKGAYDAREVSKTMRARYGNAGNRSIAAHTFYYFGPSVILHDEGGGVRVEPPRSGPSMKYAPYAGNKY